jgi:hypothetical protein
VRDPFSTRLKTFGGPLSVAAVTALSFAFM